MRTDTNFKISIPKPCHEDWNKFTPDEKGAFCKVCSKSVHDFTAKSDEEVRTILVEEISAGNKVCGRFNEDQIVDTIIESPSLSLVGLNFRRLQKFAVALFLVFGGMLFTTTKVSAQKRMGKVAYIPRPEPKKGEVSVDYEEPEKDTTTSKIDTTKTPDPKISKCTNINTVKGNVVADPVDIEINIEPLMGEVEVRPDPETVFVQAVVNDTILTDTLQVEQMEIEEPMIMGMVALPDNYIDVPVVDDTTAVIDAEFAVPESTDVEITEIEVTEETHKNDNILSGSGSLGTEAKNDETALICFPNPSRGILNLKYNVKENAQTGIALYDLSGSLVKTLLAPQKIYASDYSARFDISELPDGVYFCELVSGGKKYTQRVILGR